ncbi:MAG TPA: hypothetical protein VE988_06830 [Gemmataceae bacterium]|nr:hypothetical protein [Gemmataceae bacterium]
MRWPAKRVLKILPLLLFAVAVLVCANLNIKIEWPVPALPDDDDPAVAKGLPVIVNGLRFTLIAPKELQLRKRGEEPTTTIKLRIDNTTNEVCRLYLHGEYAMFVMRDADGKVAIHSANGGMHEPRKRPAISLAAKESQIIAFDWYLIVSTGGELPPGALANTLKGTLLLGCENTFGHYWVNTRLSRGAWQLRFVCDIPEHLSHLGPPFYHDDGRGAYWTGRVEVMTDIFIQAEGAIKA